jgi:hypothetical protein
VLPEVGSTIVPPGLRAPDASAASTILTAMRSLALPPGLRYSIFAATIPDPGDVTELSFTSGVLPISSTMWSAMRIRSILALVGAVGSGRRFMV